MASISLAAPAAVRRTTAPSRPAVRTTSGARPLRLTRRARRLARTVVVLVLVVAALVVSGLSRGAVSQAGTGPAVSGTRTVVVQPGQTLWTIARSLTPEADPRETVARIQELNNLSGSGSVSVRPGQALVVPAEG